MSASMLATHNAIPMQHQNSNQEGSPQVVPCLSRRCANSHTASLLYRQSWVCRIDKLLAIPCQYLPLLMLSILR